MPYAPGTAYRGDEYLAQGVASIGQNISKLIDRRKSESQEAAILRRLAGIYDPANKDTFQTMSLKELRAAGQGFALDQQLKADQLNQRKQQAEITNYEADNARANQFLELQKGQEQRAMRRERSLEGFGRDYANEVPMVLRPDIRQQYDGPDGRFRYALSRNPGAVDPDVMQNLSRLASQSVDPIRQQNALTAAANAEANLNNSLRTRGTSGGLTVYQDKSLAAREKDRADRVAVRVRQDIREELDMLSTETKTPEVLDRIERLRGQLDELRTPAAKPTEATTTGEPAFSTGGFLEWKKNGGKAK